MAEGAKNEAPLWLGFVEDAYVISKAANVNVKGYLITLPSDVPRHVASSHGSDGRGQRPAEPSDYENLLAVLNEADSLKPGGLGRNGRTRVMATKNIESETYWAVFEVLAGKKNGALALISLVIKTEK